MPIDYKNLFDGENPISNYWVGFIMGDGCIHYPKRGGSPSVSITLSMVDLQHLYKFRDFLCSDNKVSISKNKKYCAFRIHNKDICESLYKFGVVPQKSKTAKIINLNNNIDFWRGVIDADGCISVGTKNTRAVLLLVGSFELLSQFREFLILNGITTHAKVGKHKSIYQIGMSGKNAVESIELLYKDAVTYLDRKKEYADFILNNKSFYIPTQKHIKKLTEKDVKEIFLSPELPTAQLADKYNVTTRTILHIRHREIWKHVTNIL